MNPWKFIKQKQRSRAAACAALLFAVLVGSCGVGSKDDAEGRVVGAAQRLVTDGQVCIQVQQGTAGVAEDATIWQTVPNWNDGTSTRLWIGPFGGLRKALLRFDLSDVPNGATLTQATASLFQLPRPFDGTVNVHRVTAPWAEGSVTWTSFAGAFDSAPAGTLDVFGGGAKGFRTLDLLPLAQDWVSGTFPNEGILLNEPVGDKTEFRSAQDVMVAERPKLDVCYVTCTDGMQNGNETGVDCGGSACAPCCDGDADDEAICSTFIAIKGGSCHSIGLRGDGTVWGWDDWAAQALDGSHAPTLYPIQGMTDVVAIDASGRHSIALKRDGTVWEWRRHGCYLAPEHYYYGEEEEEEEEEAEVDEQDQWGPVQVQGLSGVVAVAAGDWHSLAVKQDGAVWAWGENSNGQLGNGTYGDSPVPVRVSGLTGAVAVAASAHFSVAIAQGKVWAWGGKAQCGRVLWPLEVTELSGVTAIAEGHDRLFAVHQDGNLSEFGLRRCSGYMGEEEEEEEDEGDNGDSDLHGGEEGIWKTMVHAVSNVIAVAPGREHALVLKQDGTVWAWGLAGPDQLGDSMPWGESIVQVPGLSGVVAIGAGRNHSLAAQQGSALWQWGFYQSAEARYMWKSERRPASVVGLTSVAKMSAGQDHSLAVSHDGSLWAWGANYTGQVGDNTTMTRTLPVPVPVPGLTGVIGSAAGGYHSLALKQDGTVWAWGNNYYGQLGDGTSTTRYQPAQVYGLTDAIAVAAGEYHSLALKQDGTVWAWGSNYDGQLGDGTRTIRNQPGQVLGLTNVVAVAAGHSHSMALRQDGTVWAWGANWYGKLGDGTETDRLQPVQVLGLTNVIAIAASGATDHSLAAKQDGTVWTWGANHHGSLGNGTDTPYTVGVTSPVQVQGLFDIVAVAAGEYRSFGLGQDGSVWAWGSNVMDVLGTGTPGYKILPVKLPDVVSATGIAAGNNHAMIRLQDGTAQAWGSNQSGQTGTDPWLWKPRPVPIP